MRNASLQYKALMQRALKPATQVRFNEAVDEGYVSLGSPDNVDTVLMRGFEAPSVPNYRRFATLDTFGWKVDDASYACASYTQATLNNCFITKPLTANTDVPIQDNLGIAAGTVYLKVAPIHCDSLTIKFGLTDHRGGFAETPQEVTIDGTTMTDFVTVEFTTTGNLYLLAFNVSEACRISYYPLSTNNEDPVAIFDNSNLLSVDIEEFVDLYSQELPRFNVVAKIYDAEGKYDPINPQGEFSKFVQDYSVRMLVGYEVNGFFEAPFNEVLYLNDTPRYENHEITLNFTNTKSADNKYRDTLPAISGNPGDPVANKTYRSRNGLVSIDSSGFESLITNDELNQIIVSIYGNGFVLSPMEWNVPRAVYRATSELKAFTNYEIVEKNSIKIDRKPVLKALTIKQYTNYIPATYQDTTSGVFTNSAYEQWSTTDVRPYRAIIDVSEVDPDADFSDVCRVDELSLTGATNMAWGFVNYVDPDTGAARLQLYIYCSSYNFSGQSTYELGLYHVKQNVNDVTESVNTEGENMIIDNPFITDRSLLESCSNWVKQVSNSRDYYTFDAIADYRIDVCDWIEIDTPYEKKVPLLVTGIKYKIPGGTCTITGNRRFSLVASNYAGTVNRFAHLNGVEYIAYVDYALVGYFHTTGGRTDVVVVTPSNGTNATRIQAPAIGYDTNVDGNVITINDSMNLTWYTDIADHSIPGEWITDDCMYLGTFTNVEKAACYLIMQAYAEQGYDVTLEA